MKFGFDQETLERMRREDIVSHKVAPKTLDEMLLRDTNDICPGIEIAWIMGQFGRELRLFAHNQERRIEVLERELRYPEGQDRLYDQVINLAKQLATYGPVKNTPARVGCSRKYSGRKCRGRWLGR